jgi:CheY-like chemotaxis protein
MHHEGSQTPVHRRSCPEPNGRIEVVDAEPARAAIWVRDARLHTDPVSRFEVLYLGANFHHRTGGFVAQDHRLFDHKWADSAVFVVVYVAGADAHGVNGYLHVMGSDLTGARPTESSKFRVLVVDDNADSAEAIGKLLQLEGQEVRCAFGGASAVEIARQFEPHLVLLDISMPGIDGYEVLRRLREQSGVSQPIVAALTGFGQPEDRRRTQEAGFDHHLVKPFGPDVLKAVDPIARTKIGFLKPAIYRILSLSSSEPPA